MADARVGIKECRGVSSDKSYRDHDTWPIAVHHMKRVTNASKCCVSGEKVDTVKLIHNTGSNNYSRAGDYMASLRTSVCRHFPFNRRRIKKSSLKSAAIVLLMLCILVSIQLFYGVVEKYFLEMDFRKGFKYPLDISDFRDVVERFRETESSGFVHQFEPHPTNLNYSSITFIQSPEVLSNVTEVGLLIIVKSASWNYKKRMAIRRTWGDPDYLSKHSMSADLPTKVCFICGMPNNFGGELFADEVKYGDIILAEFQDSYGNNTFKTMLLMRWALEYMKNFKYLMIVDDDMYISPQNTLAFIKNIPNNMEVQTVISGNSGVSAYYQISQVESYGNNSRDIIGDIVTLDGKPLIMGQLWVDSRPMRNVFGGGSKWALSIDEYAYNYFPPYIAGAATLIDNATVANLYYGSLFTRHFWIDDVYIGIIAKKLGIILTHSELMDASYRSPTDRLKHNFTEMIAIHGLKCPEQLEELWRVKDIYSLHGCDEL